MVWFNLSLAQILFSFGLRLVMIMSLKQRKIKFEPRIKLSNRYSEKGAGGQGVQKPTCELVH